MRRRRKPPGALRSAPVWWSRVYPAATIKRPRISSTLRKAVSGQLTALQNYTGQIDNLFGTTAAGLSTALQNYYSAWSAVANDPTSTAPRQALLGNAQSLAGNIQTTSTQLNNLNSDVNTRITADVQQINSIGASIATLNQQIVERHAQRPAASRPMNCSISAISWCRTSPSWSV